MKGKIEVDSELCKGCEFCVSVCPGGIFTTTKSSALPFVSNGRTYAVAVSVPVFVSESACCQLSTS